MSALAPAAASAPRRALRVLASAAGVALAVSVGALTSRIAPATPLAPWALGLLALAAAGGLVATLEEAALSRAAAAFALGAFVALGAALSSAAPDELEAAFGVASLGLAASSGYALAIGSGRRVGRFAWRSAALGAGLIAALGFYAVVYVRASRDLMIADFIFYRQVSVAVATLLEAGRWPQLIAALVVSMKDDYSWAPALAPGVVMAASAPLSRLAYEAPLIVCYAAPGVAALGVLARDLAQRAGRLPLSARGESWPRKRASGGQRAKACGGCLDPRFRGGDSSREGLFVPAFVMAAAVAAYPTGVAVAARGMPDIGGLVLYVAALRLAERLIRLLALPAGHDIRVGRMVRRVALALALTVFAMFLFRRWYAFAAVGVAAALALEVGLVAAVRGAAFRWRETAMAASLGVLVLLALLSPVLVDWLPNPGAHDYAALYAAYRKPWPVFLDEIGDWVGAGVLALALAGAAFLFLRSTDCRLLRLTVVAAIVAAYLFLRVQTPYVHHLYLVAPALTALIGAPLALLFGRSRLAGLAALAALAAVTLTPAAGAFAPRGVAPIAGRPHPPRADLAELTRLKDWVDARATPDHRVCGLGSSYTFSGQLIAELWQLEETRSPLYGDPKLRPDVKMSDVDTVEGPPNPDLKTCAIMIVGDPVQTHLDPAYQQTVIVPSREMLAGEGIGAHYRRIGEVFHLEKGVDAVVFERTAPLGDADMAALTERWRAARARVAAGLRGELRP
ncbi:MAG TPA: hypothetical protein VGH40_20935 [Roseiarcus sp.]